MIGIFAYLFSYLVRPQDFISFMLGWNIVDYIVIATLLIGLFSLVHHKKTILVPQTYLIIAYLFVAALSNVLNGDFTMALEKFIYFFKPTAIFFMFISIINSKRQLKWTMFFMILLTVFLAIQSIYQSKYGINIAGQTLTPGYVEPRVRWVGMWDGPNVLCMLFVITISFALEFIFGPYSFLFRLINTVCAGFLLYGVKLTNSRGGFTALLATLAFYFFIRIKNKKKAMITGIVLAAAFLIFLSPSRMSDIRGEASARERSWIWERGINIFMEKPIFGIGKGQYRNTRGEVAHNNFVENMADMGFIGLFLFTGIIYFSFKALYIAYKKLLHTGVDPGALSLIRATAACLVAFNVTTFFISMEHDITYIVWALCAIAFGVAQREANDMRLRFTFKDVLAISAACVFIFAGIYIIVIKDLL